MLAGILLTAIFGAAKAYQISNERYCADIIYVATTTAPTTLCTSRLLAYTLSQIGLRTLATTTSTRPCVSTFITECE